MFCFFMTVYFFILVCFVLKVGFKILDDAFHFVNLIDFVLILFNHLFDFFLFLIQTFL